MKSKDININNSNILVMALHLKRIALIQEILKKKKKKKKKFLI